MKYIIERASDGESMPCRDCVYEEAHEVLMNRSVECPDYMKRLCKDIHKEGDLWVGTRVEPEKVWTKDVDSLLDFVDQYGRIVIEHSDYVEVPFKILIYDYYIE